MKSVSGSCISSAVLAAVLPRPIRCRFDQHDARAGAREQQRGGAARDPAADDRDVGLRWRPRSGRHARRA